LLAQSAPRDSAKAKEVSKLLFWFFVQPFVFGKAFSKRFKGCFGILS